MSIDDLLKLESPVTLWATGGVDGEGVRLDIHGKSFHGANMQECVDKWRASKAFAPGEYDPCTKGYPAGRWA